MTVRRVWAEFLPPPRLREASLLEALAERSVQVLVAAWPHDVEEIAATVRAVRESGVSVGVWPMLGDAEGRWLSADSLPAFRAHLERLVDAMGRRDTRPDEIVFDLEPPIRRVRSAVRGRPREGPVPRLRQVEGTAEAIAAMVGDLRQQGVRSLAAVAPMVLWDHGIEGDRAGGWQRVLGTPVAGIGFDHVHVMAYTSLLEGYLPGVRRRDARRLLYDVCRRARRVLGPRAGVSLGLSGEGALGDERSYRSVDELRDDVAIARAAGVDDLALHGLVGVCTRGGVEPWLEALVDTAAAGRAPPPTSKAALVAGLSAGSTVVDGLLRRSRARTP